MGAYLIKCILFRICTGVDLIKVGAYLINKGAYLIKLQIKESKPCFPIKETFKRSERIACNI